MTPTPLDQLAQETAEKCVDVLIPDHATWPKNEEPNFDKAVAAIERALEAAVELRKAQVRMLEQNIVEQHNRAANELAQLRAREQRLRGALEWYAGHLRPEDRLNDNGERACQALADTEAGP